MGKVSQTIKGYFWWTSRRGSIHYDVIVTLILAFIFLAPLWINFRDKPQERPPRQTEVVVQQVDDGFLYKVDASRGSRRPLVVRRPPFAAADGGRRTTSGRRLPLQGGRLGRESGQRYRHSR